MTRDEAVARVHLLLGNRSDQATNIQNALQDVQARLEREDTLPWFLRTEISSTTTTVSEERVAVPTDFLAEWEDDALWYFNSAATDPEDVWVKLQKAENDLLRAKYPGSGAPKAYSLDGMNYRIFPTPDDVYTLKQIYYAADTVLTTNITNGWLTNLSELLIGMAGQEVGFPLGLSETRINRFRELESNGRTRLIRKNLELAMTNRGFQIGGPD